MEATTYKEITSYRNTAMVNKAQLPRNPIFTELEKMNLSEIYDYQIEICNNKLRILECEVVAPNII